MPAPLKIVAVHGIGNHQNDLGWQASWRDALQQAVQLQNADTQIDVRFVMHDRLFDEVPNVAWTQALGQLLGSWFWNGLRDRTTERGLVDRLSQYRQYYAGMVAKWVSNVPLRKRLRQLLWDEIEGFQPDLLIGHSLGSLVSYDMLLGLTAGQRAQLSNLTFMSVGSQIGHPSVRNVFGGRLTMPPVRRWLHIYNPADHVFTTPIEIARPGFQQVVIRQNVPGATSEHDAVGYFSDDEAAIAWKAIAAPTKEATRTMGVLTSVDRALRPPQHRALLVGINKYAGGAPDLGGCVNDSFLMSALLQESGFDAAEIRMLIDERATAEAIRDRIAWLLEDVQSGDIRILHYSGHGAQIPAYGWKEEVDHIDECLCPHDFDWSLERAITDDWLHQTYSQLPYDSYFLAILDCCHSGGLARGGVSVRGLTPPDDIRHRMLRWNSAAGMWETRSLPEASPAFADRREFTGASRSVYRLGRAIPLRQMSGAEFDRTTKEFDHRGPYMPVLFEACREAELAEEYQAGSQSYGVFTYALVKSLRLARATASQPSFQEVFQQAVLEVQRLGHSQQPQVVGPTAVLKLPVPLSIAMQQTSAASRDVASRASKPKAKPRLKRAKAAPKRPTKKRPSKRPAKGPSSKKRPAKR